MLTLGGPTNDENKKKTAYVTPHRATIITRVIAAAIVVDSMSGGYGRPPWRTQTRGGVVGFK